MRYIARAPVHCAGRDQRPGDSFDAEPDAVVALLELGHVEVVETATPEPVPPADGDQEGAVDPAVTPAKAAGKKGRR